MNCYYRDMSSLSDMDIVIQKFIDSEIVTNFMYYRQKLTCSSGIVDYLHIHV